jgi:hypothetical protein
MVKVPVGIVVGRGKVISIISSLQELPVGDGHQTPLGKAAKAGGSFEITSPRVPSFWVILNNCPLKKSGASAIFPIGRYKFINPKPWLISSIKLNKSISSLADSVPDSGV